MKCNVSGLGLAQLALHVEDDEMKSALIAYMLAGSLLASAAYAEPVLKKTAASPYFDDIEYYEEGSHVDRVYIPAIVRTLSENRPNYQGYEKILKAYFLSMRSEQKSVPDEVLEVSLPYVQGVLRDETLEDDILSSYLLIAMLHQETGMELSPEVLRIAQSSRHSLTLRIAALRVLPELGDPKALSALWNLATTEKDDSLRFNASWSYCAMTESLPEAFESNLLIGLTSNPIDAWRTLRLLEKLGPKASSLTTRVDLLKRSGQIELPAHIPQELIPALFREG